MAIQKNILIMIGVISLSFIIIFLFSPKGITDYTVVDTEYWRETENSLLIKTVYNYNDKDSVATFPRAIGEWKGSDYKYPDFVYTKLNANILMSRAYKKGNGSVIWMDIISSKTGESFHKQKACVKGAGWNIDNESIAEFKITDSQNPYTRFYTNRLDISKGGKKQVMIYWFMFKKFGSNDSVTMIRLSSPVRNDDTDMTFNRIKGFIENQLFDEMYKDTKMEETTIIEYLIDKYGNKGLFAIMVILMIPIGITIIGIRKRN